MSEPLYTTAQIRAIEPQYTGLMEKAGLAASELVQRLASSLAKDNLPLLILAGPGNNGGDALVAARYLKQWGIELDVLFTGDAAKLPPDAKAAYQAWLTCGGAVLTEIPDRQYGLIVDGLFGIGLTRNLDAAYLTLIRKINDMDAPVLALDVPSGLCADTGRILGAAIKADHTLTFIGLKPGLFTLDGADVAGQIHLTELGIDPSPQPPLQGGKGVSGWLINSLPYKLPARKRNSHKGSYGSVAIIGGAEGMAGAALLAARAALLSGTGRVYAALLAENTPAVDLLHPEIMLRSPDKLAELPQLDCVVVGPGMGQSPAAIKLLEYWIAQNVPLLLDADALNLLSTHPHLRDAMQARKAASVITPHPGEAARLLGCNAASIQQDRSKSALKLAKELNAICVLKGAGSICAHPNGEWFINASGNPGLASAGMGDALSGIISSFIAQRLCAIDAAKLGVYLHGAAADALVEQGIGPVGLTASEISLEVRKLVNQYNLTNTIVKK